MLPILHKAFNLFREDAYANYCWNVDAYGTYEPASFIYLCYEALRDAMASERLLLMVPTKPFQTGSHKHFPSRADREWHLRPADRFLG